VVTKGTCTFTQALNSLHPNLPTQTMSTFEAIAGADYDEFVDSLGASEYSSAALPLEESIGNTGLDAKGFLINIMAVAQSLLTDLSEDNLNLLQSHLWQAALLGRYREAIASLIGENARDMLNAIQLVRIFSLLPFATSI
jgi:hypothetical protein